MKVDISKIESDIPPTERPSGKPLQENDIWHDSDSGDRYVWSDDLWRLIDDRLIKDNNVGPITKRERFAMAAMQGILSNPNVGLSEQAWPLWLAKTSRLIAEDQLAELEKVQEA